MKNIRVAQIAAETQFKFRGGGSFVTGFKNIADANNWQVDIICDKPHKFNAMTNLIKDWNWIYPDDPLDYKDFTRISQWNNTINIEMMLNFRNALIKACQSNIYDLIVLNIPEAVPAALSLNLDVPIVHYTHYHDCVMQEEGKLSQTDSYTQSGFNMMVSLYDVKGTILGTQSKYNLSHIKTSYTEKNLCLPMTLPNVGWLDAKQASDSWGVGWVGPIDSRKNWPEFLRLIKDTGLPPRILTKPKSADKMRKQFAEAGINKFEIQTDLTDEEKLKYISSWRMGYFPSKREGFGLGCFECAHVIPTLLLTEYHWWKHFPDLVYHSTKENIDKIAIDLYNNGKAKDKQYFIDYEKNAAEEWAKVIDQTSKNYGNNGVDKWAQNNKESCIQDYTESQSPRLLNETDFRQLSQLRFKTKLYHDKNGTFLSEQKRKNTESLFDF